MRAPLYLFAGWIAALMCITPAAGQEGHITLDEDFADWAGILPVIERDQGQGFFRRVRITNDDRYLFLFIEVNDEIVLQERGIVLSIDTDADKTTGTPISGIGADLRWHFGDKIGSWQVAGVTSEIRHPVIGIVSAPTLSGRQFEIAIDRAATYSGAAIFPSDSIRFVLADDLTGDQVPGGQQGFTYVFEERQRGRAPVSLTRSADAHFRVVSYNVLRDGPFFGRDATFGRILKALDPDIIGFSEMYSTSADFVASWLERDLPSAEGEQWFVARAANDVMLASRYPILSVENVRHSDRFAPRTGMFQLDLRPDVDSDLILYVTHTACCRNDVARQEQLDAMMAHLRDARDQWPADTPFMLLGDFNLVTEESQRRTVLYGEISDAGTFGPSFGPDWDEGPLADLRPEVAGLPMTYTWYDERSVFSPGRLDYIFYSPATITALHGFSLHTPALQPEVLQFHGLEAYDTVNASDHLPVVGDFRITGTGTHVVPDAGAGSGSAKLDLVLYPNPASAQTTVRLSAATAGGSLHVYNVVGQRVATVTVPPAPAHADAITIDTGALPPGMYLLRYESEGTFYFARLLVAG
jgi:endonuclease/exonuclease/phosphatase family metal-dependent hydrolase